MGSSLRDWLQARVPKGPEFKTPEAFSNIRSGEPVGSRGWPGDRELLLPAKAFPGAALNFKPRGFSFPFFGGFSSGNAGLLNPKNPF